MVIAAAKSKALHLWVVSQFEFFSRVSVFKLGPYVPSGIILSAVAWRVSQINNFFLADSIHGGFHLT